MSGVLLPLSLFGAGMLLLAASAVLTYPRLTTAQAALAEQQAATGARAEHIRPRPIGQSRSRRR